MDLSDSKGAYRRVGINNSKESSKSRAMKSELLPSLAGGLGGNSLIRENDISAKITAEAFGLTEESTMMDLADSIDWQFLRTSLANERTFLAWVRTSLTLFSFGYGILKVESYLSEDTVPWYDHIVAYTFSLAGIFAFILGCTRFIKVKVLIKMAERLEIGRCSMRLFMSCLAFVLLTGVVREVANDAYNGHGN